MANPLNPAETALGLDIAISSAKVEMRVNDVPVFDPVAQFGSTANITTRIPMNAAFRQGTNSVELTLSPVAGEGFPTEFRARLRWWPAGVPELPFQDEPFAVELSVIATETGLRMVAEPGTQEHLSISGLEAFTDINGLPAARFTVDIEMDLPGFAWMDAAPLELTPEIETGIRRAYKRLGDALLTGPDGARQALAPFIARQAAVLGASPQQFFDASLAPIFDPESGFEVQPVDPAEGEIRLFGDGRLAAILPIPLTFSNTTTGQVGTLYVYLWKDSGGNWQIIH